MSTEIKRLKQQGKDFVPITLAEAVVVNTNSIPGWPSTTITTLDKVLQALGLSLGNLNDALDGKQDILTAGAGITIQNGVISTTAVTTLYKIVTVEQFTAMTAAAEYMNMIYLVPVSSTAENSFAEYICIPKDTEQGTEYYWEKLGEVQTEIDLSGYVTITDFQAFAAQTITAVNVTTSSNQQVIVTYDIPADLYDAMIVPEITV